MPLSKTRPNQLWYFKYLKGIQYAAYYGSYLAWAVLVGAIWEMSADPQNGWWWLLLGLCILFIYMRWVEPASIRIRKEKLVVGKSGESVRLVFVSDLHLGIFKKEKFLQKILEKVTEWKPDLFIIGGDLINDPTKEEFKKILKPLKKMPEVLAITGNHDAGVPGDFSSQEVRDEMERVGVRAIDNRVIQKNIAGRDFSILGLSDLMEGKVDWAVLKKLGKDSINIIVAHNPDSAYQVPKEIKVDLLISGHTHGGQIYLPPLSNWLIPCKYPFVRGWYQVHGHPIYVSSGAGEVVLPMRFLIPPELVVVDMEI